MNGYVMFGLGTIINTLAVLAGSLIGLGLKKGMKPRFQEILISACGLGSLFIGASGAMAGMLTFTDGTFGTQGGMLLVVSLVIGGLLGEALNIEQKMDSLGEKLKKLFRADGDNRFVEGFVSTSLVICVGAMAIVGAMQDGLSGDYSTLAVKAILDLVIVIVFAAGYGPGVACSAIPLFLYQGAITVAAHFAGAFVPQPMIDDLSFVGSVLIFCVGVNLAFGKKFKVANLLPALLVPVAWYFIF